MPEFDKLRVAVIGGCQVVGISAALRSLLPGATVNPWHVGAPLPAAEIAEKLPGQDIIVSQIHNMSGHSGLGIDDLRETYAATKRIVYVPTLIFHGLQPDVTTIMFKDNVLNTALGTMHSYIIMAAYSLSIPARDVPRLFNGAMYQSLGYMDYFVGAKARLLEQYASHGFDVSPHLTQWLRAGSFMHTPLHPRIDALASLATMSAVQLDLTAPDTVPPRGLHDALGFHEIWPTYPELSAPLGFAGSLVFHRDIHFANGEQREWSLDEVVDAAYALYPKCDGLNMMNRTVKATRAKIEVMA